MQNIAYKLNDKLYLNITNRCTNACSFCIRYLAPKFHGEYNLWLDHEPNEEEILAAIGDPTKHQEIVFCGYGEPLIRLDTVKAVSDKLKTASKKVKIRINTNGQANLFYGRNVLPELMGLVDAMDISLNAESASAYNKLCHSMFGIAAYQAVVEFVKEAKKHIPELEITVVDLPNEINIEQIKKTARELGVSLRIRSYYEEKYVR
ncbi:MAG: TatD family nuclease-associated radical SAM protein [Candidatus Margulisiibacteriota bacterium]|nr:TatD family nuclease-associated radical SAM protein [Candidatus Margulisiibacteriota bacterium]